MSVADISLVVGVASVVIGVVGLLYASYSMKVSQANFEVGQAKQLERIVNHVSDISASLAALRSLVNEEEYKLKTEAMIQLSAKADTAVQDVAQEFTNQVLSAIKPYADVSNPELRAGVDDVTRSAFDDLLGSFVLHMPLSEYAVFRDEDEVQLRLLAEQLREGLPPLND